MNNCWTVSNLNILKLYPIHTCTYISSSWTISNQPSTDPVCHQFTVHHKLVWVAAAVEKRLHCCKDYGRNKMVAPMCTWRCNQLLWKRNQSYIINYSFQEHKSLFRLDSLPLVHLFIFQQLGYNEHNPQSNELHTDIICLGTVFNAVSSQYSMHPTHKIWWDIITLMTLQQIL